MPLITTPGSDEADSYIDVSDFKNYADRMGYDLGDKTDVDIEQALRRGTRWIDATYGARFIGEPTDAAQSLEWPRKEAFWRGVEFGSNIIPNQVKNAASEAAWRELTEPGSLSPDFIGTERVLREKVGELEVQYADVSGGVDDATPVVSVVDGLLSALLVPKSKALFGTAARA